MGVNEIVEDIKKRIPSVRNVISFYSDGTVYYSSFSKDRKCSIPDLGKFLADIIEKFKNIHHTIKDYEVPVEAIKYKQILYSADNLGIIIIRLGEESNVALIFDDLSINKVNLGDITTDLSEMEDIMDTTEEELKKIGYDEKSVEKKREENEEFLNKLPGKGE